MAKKAEPRKKTTKPKAKKKPSQKKGLTGRIFKVLFILGFLAALSAFMLFGAVYIGLFGKLPSKEDLLAIKQDNASVVYSKDGMLLGKYFVQNRSQVAFGEIPDIVIDALVATEDSRFFYHEGIDFSSIPRVVVKTIILGDKSGGGGSTISQQLVKNIYGRENFGSLSMPVNKLKENIIALKIEDIYSKEEIITLYLNTVSFGENVFGIKAASQRYFSKLPRDLSLPETATLIGMLKANTTYNPRLNPENAKERRNTVMYLMVEAGSLENSDYEIFKEEDIKLNYQNVVGSKGMAPYLRSQLEPEIKEILSGLNKEDGSAYNLYTDGLRIELTLNGKLQELAEQAVRSNMKKLQAQFDKHWEGKSPWGNDNYLWRTAQNSLRYKRLADRGLSEAEIKTIFNVPTELYRYTYDGIELTKMSPIDSVAYHQMILQAGFFAMNPHTGEVVAYVGGVDHNMFPYDHIYAKRQVGSVFKPFVYTAALQIGFEPCDFIENEPLIFSNYDDWSPSNSGGPIGGYYSVKGGLAKSVNTVAARLISETGPGAVIQIARDYGIEGNIPEVPSIALGVANLSLREMVNAYSPFVNDGYRVSPQFIHRITTNEGLEIYRSKPIKRTRVADAELMGIMREMLELVVDSGTARSIRTQYGVRSPLAGKTGTTQNNADGWFIGFTPNLVFGAWVGGETNKVRFRSTALGQGAATALPIVGTWLRAIEKNKNSRELLGLRFNITDDNMAERFDCVIYSEKKPRVNFFKGLFEDEIEGEDRMEVEDPADEEDGERDGWMKRLIDKIKK
jgi:penicillin-binding protein 1A